jgi:hypothetical protein
LSRSLIKGLKGNPAEQSPFELMDFLGSLTRQSIPTPELLEAILKLNKALNPEPPLRQAQTLQTEFQTEQIPPTQTSPKESSNSCKRPPGITNSILREDPS